MNGVSARFWRIGLASWLAWFLSQAVASGQGLLTAELQPETLNGWAEYQRLTERRIASELESNQRFLVQEFLPSSVAARCRDRLAGGGFFVHPLSTLWTLVLQPVGPEHLQIPSAPVPSGKDIARTHVRRALSRRLLK